MGLFKKLFKTTPKGYYKTFDVGNFVVDLFYDENDAEYCYAEIRSAAPSIEIKLCANHDGYGLLMSAAADDDEQAIAGYCSMLAISATLLAIDTPFVGVVNKGFQEWQDRKLEEAKAEAEKIMPSDEEAAQALMEEVVELTELPEAEQRGYVQGVIDNIKGKSKGKKKKK